MESIILTSESLLLLRAARTSCHYEQKNSETTRAMHSEEKKQPTSFSVNHILQAAENTVSGERPRETDGTNTDNSSEDSNVKITLDEADLWRRFKSLTNEMIVTKNGR